MKERIAPQRSSWRWPAGWRPAAWSAAGRASANLLLLVAGGWLYAPVFQYLGVLFTREEFRVNQVVLAAVAGVLLYRWRSLRIRPRLDAPPRLFAPGLVLALLASSGYLLAERFLDINTLSASLFVLASYGLLGLWLAPGRWRRGFPAALLVVGVLPFGAHLETFVGYPVRILTASLVRDGLAALGLPSVGMDTILIFESGVSQVDIPCSGAKSLWSGALFLLAATWVEDRPVNLRWLLAAAAGALLLLGSNFIRVAALALVGPALGWEQLAGMLHLPLGVLGFGGACAAMAWLLGRLPKPAGAAVEPSRAEAPRPAWLGPALALAAALGALVYTPRPAEAQPVETIAWSFAGGITAQPTPLNEQELAWVRQGGAERADRFSFQWQPGGDAQPVNGAVMFLTSQTWRGQHQPERCFEVFGLEVREAYTYLAGPDFPIRHLALAAPGAPQHVSAVYWLQSPTVVTEDYGHRIWADLSPARERWVLVTALLDREVDLSTRELDELFEALRQSAHSSVWKGRVP